MDLKPAKFDTEIHPSPDSSGEAVVRQRDLYSAVELKRPHGDTEVHLPMDTKLPVGAEIAVYPYSNEIEEIDGEFIDPDLKDPTRLLKGQVSRTFKQNNTYLP